MRQGGAPPWQKEASHGQRGDRPGQRWASQGKGGPQTDKEGPRKGTAAFPLNPVQGLS